MSSLFSTFFLPIPVDGSSILRQIFKYNFTGYANPLAIIIVVQTGSIRGGGRRGFRETVEGARSSRPRPRDRCAAEELVSWRRRQLCRRVGACI